MQTNIRGLEAVSSVATVTFYNHNVAIIFRSSVFAQENLILGGAEKIPFFHKVFLRVPIL
jgi:hypothetical protein